MKGWSSEGLHILGKNHDAIVRGAAGGMRACHSKVVGDRIRRSKQDSGDDAAHTDSMAAFRLLDEGHSLHPRIRTSIHESTGLPLAVGQKSAAACTPAPPMRKNGDSPERMRETELRFGKLRRRKEGT